MHREAYLDPGKYKHSEYRHGLALRGCEGVVIQDLNISQSGGDSHRRRRHLHDRERKTFGRRLQGLL
jgi:hypothetical protein